MMSNLLMAHNRMICIDEILLEFFKKFKKSWSTDFCEILVGIYALYIVPT